MEMVEPYFTQISRLHIGKNYYDSSPQTDEEWGVGSIFVKPNQATLVWILVREIEDDSDDVRFEYYKENDESPVFIQRWSESDMIQLRVWFASQEWRHDDEHEELKELLKKSFQDLTLSQFLELNHLMAHYTAEFDAPTSGQFLSEGDIDYFFSIEELVIRK